MTTTRKKSPAKAAATKSRKKPAKVADPEIVTMSSVYATVASRKNIDTTKAGKLVRSKLRGNFAKVCELDPNVPKVKPVANDGNRWPTHITRELSDYLAPPIK